MPIFFAVEIQSQNQIFLCSHKTATVYTVSALNWWLRTTRYQYFGHNGRCSVPATRNRGSSDNYRVLLFAHKRARNWSTRPPFSVDQNSWITVKTMHEARLFTTDDFLFELQRFFVFFSEFNAVKRNRYCCGNVLLLVWCCPMMLASRNRHIRRRPTQTHWNQNIVCFLRSNNNNGEKSCDSFISARTLIYNFYVFCEFEKHKHNFSKE